MLAAVADHTRQHPLQAVGSVGNIGEDDVVDGATPRHVRPAVLALEDLKVDQFVTITLGVRKNYYELFCFLIMVM